MKSFYIQLFPCNRIYGKGIAFIQFANRNKQFLKICISGRRYKGISRNSFKKS